MPAASLSAAVAPRPAPLAAAAPRIGASGWLLMLCALLLGASAIRAMRVEIAGMLVHPVNFGIVLLFIVAAPKRLGLLPQRIAFGLFGFAAMFLISALLRDRSTTTMIKFGASMFTLLAAAIAVNSDLAFRRAALGLSIAVGFISARGLTGFERDTLSGLNPMVGIANENAFSLFALPSLMIGTYMALQSSTPRMQRAIFVISSIVTVMVLFSTANRSGWLGAVIISGLLSLRAVRRMKTFFVLTAVVGFAVFVVLEFGNLRMVEMNIQITQEGYRSDQLRRQLMFAALDVGLNNPILGCSPQRLPFELARRIPFQGHAIDAHNVFALIFGGCGFLGIISLCLFGWLMWQRPRGVELSPRARDAHFLMRCILIVWCSRGMFSGEIIFSPSFSLAIGMTIGLCIANNVWPRMKPAVPRRPSLGPMPPRRGPSIAARG